MTSSLNPLVAAPFRGGGIEYLHDLDSYAGWGFLLLVGSPKPDRLKGRGQTKQHRPLAGTQMLGLHRCAFLPGGLFSGFRLRACNLCIPLEWSGRGKSSESHVYSVDNVFMLLPPASRPQKDLILMGVEHRLKFQSHLVKLS